MEDKGGERMTLSGKEAVKRVLGQIPFTAELYWLLRQRGKPLQSRFSLKHLQAALPEISEQVLELRKSAQPGRKVFIFATLHYWIEHATVLGAALSAQGHDVTLGYLPYADWQKPINRFDLRRQNLYARRVLDQAGGFMKAQSFLNQRPYPGNLPNDIEESVRQVSIYDTQYTLQIEEVDQENEVFKLRMKRNRETALAAMAWLKTNHPDVVIIPNGTVQELGIVYRVAKHLKIPTITYEFGDQRERIWVAQNREVMRQETDGMWDVRRDHPLTDDELERVKSMYSARQKGSTWENFARAWQQVPSEGGEKVRAALGLDKRPVVLLPTNVVGDSLTLGRQVFSRSMTEWISRTLQYFDGRPDVQLVVRVHPGEMITRGVSMVEVIHQVFPRLPEHIHLIGPKEKINTYDLMEMADLGLVYTTTVGMEMAMSGLPVIVTGATHYRGRGFTYDPDSWVNYFKILGQLLDHPENFRLTPEQVSSAWQYAYRFFFEFPKPFPWHLVHIWEDYQKRPIKSVFSPKNQELYGKTFKYLVGEPIQWEIE
jgi:hypothetical protein